MENLTRQADAIELAQKLNIKVSEKNGVVFLKDYCLELNGLTVTTLVDCRDMSAHCIAKSDTHDVRRLMAEEKKYQPIADNFLKALKKYIY